MIWIRRIRTRRRDIGNPQRVVHWRHIVWYPLLGPVEVRRHRTWLISRTTAYRELLSAQRMRLPDVRRLTPAQRYVRLRHWLDGADPWAGLRAFDRTVNMFIIIIKRRKDKPMSELILTDAVGRALDDAVSTIDDLRTQLAASHGREKVAVEAYERQQDSQRELEALYGAACERLIAAETEVARLRGMLIMLRKTGHELPASIFDQTIVWELAQSDQKSKSPPITVHLSDVISRTGVLREEYSQ